MEPEVGLSIERLGFRIQFFKATSSSTHCLGFYWVAVKDHSMEAMLSTTRPYCGALVVVQGTQHVCITITTVVPYTYS